MELNAYYDRNAMQSAYTDRLIRTVYDYLRRGTLIADLLQCDVLKAAENSRFLDESYKVAKIAQSDCFVRFTVINRADGTAEDVWHSKRLYDRYIAYYDSIDSQNALCYVTGETLPVTYKHSSKIRNSGDKAKLLSLIQHGIVTGKADCSVSTGGFNVYNFIDADGNFIGSLAFEDGLLARGDGHYFFEIQK